jgi:hypothetical protein
MHAPPRRRSRTTVKAVLPVDASTS